MIVLLEYLILIMCISLIKINDQLFVYYNNGYYGNYITM